MRGSAAHHGREVGRGGQPEGDVPAALGQLDDRTARPFERPGELPRVQLEFQAGAARQAVQPYLHPLPEQGAAQGEQVVLALAERYDGQCRAVEVRARRAVQQQGPSGGCLGEARLPGGQQRGRPGVRHVPPGSSHLIARRIRPG
ncbi:hypothetical protein [Streptomyces sp. NPDC046976]|uniref:hypothetical protein n=1 Tax=Streptomyces sp. NPDC046976 TaxID=3155258 RepID=UPI003403C9F8